MITEKNITDLRNWLEFIHMDFNNQKLDPKHQEALGKMINILYGRKAKPNQVNRKKYYKKKRNNYGTLDSSRCEGR